MKLMVGGPNRCVQKSLPVVVKVLAMVRSIYHHRVAAPLLQHIYDRSEQVIGIIYSVVVCIHEVASVFGLRLSIVVRSESRETLPIAFAIVEVRAITMQHYQQSPAAVAHLLYHIVEQSSVGHVNSLAKVILNKPTHVSLLAEEIYKRAVSPLV